MLLPGSPEPAMQALFGRHLGQLKVMCLVKSKIEFWRVRNFLNRMATTVSSNYASIIRNIGSPTHSLPVFSFCYFFIGTPIVGIQRLQVTEPAKAETKYTIRFIIFFYL